MNLPPQVLVECAVAFASAVGATLVTVKRIRAVMRAELRPLVARVVHLEKQTDTTERALRRHQEEAHAR